MALFVSEFQGSAPFLLKEKIFKLIMWYNLSDILLLVPKTQIVNLKGARWAWPFTAYYPQVVLVTSVENEYGHHA